MGEGGVVLKGMYGAAAANGAPTALRTVLNAGFPSYYCYCYCTPSALIYF